MDSRGKRLKTYIKHLRLTQESFGQAIEIKKSYVNQMINDKAPISHQVLDKIIESFPTLNIQWLLVGEGDMIKPRSEKNTTQAAEPEIKYKPTNWLAELSALLEGHEDRIARLEEEVNELRGLMRKDQQ